MPALVAGIHVLLRRKSVDHYGYWCKSRDDVVQEMPARAVLDLDDPGVGIEADFTRQAVFDLEVRHRPVAERACEGAVARMRLVEQRLRRGRKQLPGPIE